MWFQRAALLSGMTATILSTIATAVLADTVDTDEVHSNALIKWLKASGGYFHPSLQMRRLNPSDPQSPFGMYTNAAIAEDTPLLKIPPSMVVESDEDATGEQLECDLIFYLAEQLNLKDESEYAPYVNYLFATQPPDQLPSFWSEEGQELLVSTLEGTNVQDGYEFAPDAPVMWKHSFYQDCEVDEVDSVLEYAAFLVIARAWDDVLIPVFDMMSHRNGKWLNTKSTSVHDGTEIVVSASRDIEMNEQIYTTYNMCEDCGNRITDYGTPEILRDYGFVEQFPQSWNFEDEDVHFRVDEVYDVEGNATGEHYISEWIHGEPVDQGILHLRKMMDQFEITLEYENQPLAAYDPNDNVPEKEWNTIRSYFENMRYAVEVAIRDYDKLMQDHGCIEDGTCTVQSLSRYINLETRELTVWDSVGEEWPTCPENNIDRAFDEDIREVLEIIESPYQTMKFTRNMEEKDTCFDLDHTLQICDSYRPQYHEMSVHMAVRFLPEFKRVLWVGGGDSMLLNEFTKYPSLELIVGLELDQRVTRGSYKYHGTQPHFDQDRVEWWFGDATKSLLMLPKSYFGTFDLVIVDLSETIMSEKVTEELDVLDMLTLLLQPDGIMLKNEFYFGKFKQMFSHSVMVHWYDNPAICSQAMVMGSWNVDFMNPNLKDFGVETLFLEPLSKIDDQFEIYHDYARNYTSKHLCHNMKNKPKKTAAQVSSPGIILIGEVEDATVDLGDLKALETSLTSALKKEGLVVLSTETSKVEEYVTITIILEEGYVVVRTDEKEKYCGFDIHFWKSLGKQEETKSALLGALGSKGDALSSYRVIAGGMFGIPTWKEDEKVRGPNYEEICKNNLQFNADDVNNPKKLGKVNESFFDGILKESISLLDTEGKNVVILSGSDVSSPSLSLVEGIDSVSSVQTIGCPSMENFNEFGENALEAVTACEKLLKTTMNDISANASEIDVLLLDSKVDRFTAAIMIRLFGGHRNRDFANEIFNEDVIVVSTIEDDSESWRRSFMQLFKTDVFYFDPACYVEVLYTDKNGAAIKLLLSSKDDEHFIQSVQSKVTDHKEQTGLYTAVELIDGAEFVIKDEESFNPMQFGSDDFDMGPSLTQWHSQKPLAHQIIFQMETEKKKRSLSKHIVRESLENAIKNAGLSGLTYNDDIIKEYSDLGGHGCVYVVHWSGGSIVVLWDGKIHVDVNLFTQKQNKKQADKFDEVFRSDTTLATMLRDEQPRGKGRVISYIDDVSDGADPVWS